MRGPAPLGERQVAAEATRAPTRQASESRRAGARVIPPSRIPARPVEEARDGHEQQADRVADAVVRRIQAGPARPGARPSSVIAATAPVGVAAGDTGAAVVRARGAGRPLDGPVREAMEQGFGADFSGVRVHEDGTAHQLSAELNAQAFTSGRDIFLARGAPGPATAGGRRLLAHELTHVLQQDAAVQAPGQVPVQRKTLPSDPQAAQASYQLALANHEAQSWQLRAWIEEGLNSTDVRLANSCEWIARGLSKLYAVSATGDSAERVRHHRGDPKKRSSLTGIPMRAGPTSGTLPGSTPSTGACAGSPRGPPTRTRRRSRRSSRASRS